MIRNGTVMVLVAVAVLAASCTTSRSESDEAAVVEAVAMRLLADPATAPASEIPVCVGPDGFRFSPAPRVFQRLRAANPRVRPCREPSSSGDVFVMVRSLRRVADGRYSVGAGHYCPVESFGGRPCTDAHWLTLDRVSGQWRVTEDF